MISRSIPRNCRRTPARTLSHPTIIRTAAAVCRRRHHQDLSHRAGLRLDRHAAGRDPRQPGARHRVAAGAAGRGRSAGRRHALSAAVRDRGRGHAADRGGAGGLGCPACPSASANGRRRKRTHNDETRIESFEYCYDPEPASSAQSIGSLGLGRGGACRRYLRPGNERRAWGTSSSTNCAT
jgi:hypothetical protein